MTIDRHGRGRGLDIYWTGQVRNAAILSSGYSAGKEDDQLVALFTAVARETFETERAWGDNDLKATRRENQKTLK